MDDDDEYEAKVAAELTPEHRAAYADHLRHLAEHAGTIPTDRVTKDTVRNREWVASGANFIFTFYDAMG
jgi:hypothetical protein